MQTCKVIHYSFVQESIFIIFWLLEIRMHRTIKVIEMAIWALQVRGVDKNFPRMLHVRYWNLVVMLLQY